MYFEFFTTRSLKAREHRKEGPANGYLGNSCFPNIFQIFTEEFLWKSSLFGSNFLLISCSVWLSPESGSTSCMMLRICAMRKQNGSTILWCAFWMFWELTHFFGFSSMSGNIIRWQIQEKMTMSISIRLLGSLLETSCCGSINTNTSMSGFFISFSTSYGYFILTLKNIAPAKLVEKK